MEVQTLDSTQIEDLEVAESSKGEISELEKALYAQHQLLQKLYSELDQERESAATAASEALSMILRLQGEKASLKMEASHYKRMAEEKMCHAEEALAVFEDLTYEREIEIAALEFQLQAYRYRLLSMGVTDVGVSEFKFPENIFGNKSSMNNNTIINKKLAIEKIKSVDGHSIIGAVEGTIVRENDDLEKKLSSCVSVDITSYWDQIKKLDERIKELSENKDSGRRKSLLLKGVTWSPEVFAQEANSTSVHDIFEVPQKSIESLKKPTLERENRLIKPDIVTKEATESAKKGEIERLKFSEKKLGKMRTAGSNYLAEYQQMSRRIERLEREKRQEIVRSRDEELSLLKEICVQIKTLQSEMKSLKAKKSNVGNEPSLDTLQEAMLHFWL